MSKLEQVKIVAQTLATVAVPLVIALVGHWFSSAMKQKELGFQYTTLAVQVLSSDPTGAAEDRAIRQWAIDVLEEYSGGAFPSSPGGDLLRYQWFATGEAAKILAKQPDIADVVTGSSDVAKAAAQQASREGESDEQRD